MTVRITEAELARDLHAVLEQVRQGGEVIRSGRPITEILDEARQRNSTVTLDADFGKDLEEIIDSHQQSWILPSWD